MPIYIWEFEGKIFPASFFLSGLLLILCISLRLSLLFGKNSETKRETWQNYVKNVFSFLFSYKNVLWYFLWHVNIVTTHNTTWVSFLFPPNLCQYVLFNARVSPWINFASWNLDIRYFICQRWGYISNGSWYYYSLLIIYYITWETDSCILYKRKCTSFSLNVHIQCQFSIAVLKLEFSHWNYTNLVVFPWSCIRNKVS